MCAWGVSIGVAGVLGANAVWPFLVTKMGYAAGRIAFGAGGLPLGLLVVLITFRPVKSAVAKWDPTFKL